MLWQKTFQSNFFSSRIAHPNSVQLEVYLDTEKYHQVSVGSSQRISIVHYLPYGQYSPEDPPDIFVAWRYFVSLGLTSLGNQNPRQHKMKRILWLHDLLQQEQLPTEVSNHVKKSFSFFSDET